MRDNAHKGIVGFIVKYRVTFLLVIMSAVLIKQNFLVNDFPNVIKQKQKSINEIVSTNKQLENENLDLTKQIHGYTQEDMTLVESKARFKYGLIAFCTFGLFRAIFNPFQPRFPAAFGA